MEPTYDVVGIGNALVDVIATATDDQVDELGLTKGAMRLIDESEARSLYERIGPAVERSGGSAANTVVGVASLGGRSAFIGRVAADQLGAVFAHDIDAAGVYVDLPRAPDGPESGRCLILVTPDAERTMNTFLGASSDLGPADVDTALLEVSRVTYLEGYLFDPPAAKDAFRLAARTAAAAGRMVALSLSDQFCVDRHRDDFLALLDDVDIVFGNEEELISLTQAGDFDGAASHVAEHCRLVALTRGAAGSVVIADGARVDVPADPVDRVVDTTGAGDLYAAGFLFGLTRGAGPRRCAQLGSLAAAEVISHTGGRPDVSLADLAADAGLLDGLS